MTDRGMRARVRTRVPGSPIDGRDRRWLGWPLLVGVAVAALYVLSNDYPAYGAGLYTLTADTIRANGYALPATVPHYGPKGVPLAYPPLAFYLLAVVRDLGAGTFSTALFLPPLVTVVALIPAYLLGRDIVGDRRAGTAVALLLVLNPQTIEWHISAGGLVRAGAFVLALTGSYAALRIFRDGDREWVPVGLIAVVLVALTHPTYTLFTVVTFLLFWAGYDRSLIGLVRGAVVGLGALVVVSPWLVTVLDIHGPVVFSGAAGTHGGVGGGLYRLQQWGPTGAIVGIVAGIGLLATRRRVLGCWIIAVWLLFAQPRFAYTVGAIAVVGAVSTAVEREWLTLPSDRHQRAIVATLLVVSAVGLGGIGYEFTGPDGTTPEFVDDDDVSAMTWATEETRPDATFVVLGDAAEWFPVVAERTILVSLWGAEWWGPDTYESHLDAFRAGSHCDSVDCLETAMTTVDARPNYVYVPNGSYTVRGGYRWADGELIASMEASQRYRPVFENDGVVVFRRANGSVRTQSSSSETRSE